jgi:cell division protein FtsL
LFANVTPLGSVPLSLSDGVGVPVVVAVKLPAVPTVNVVLLALVIAGAWSTVSVKHWVAVPALLLAVIVIM